MVRIFHRQNDRAVQSLGPLLGILFDVTPFPLSKLTSNFKAFSNVGTCGQMLSNPPFSLSDTGKYALLNSIKDEMNDSVSNFNKEVDVSLASMSLQSSLGEKSSLGGVCWASDSSLSGLLQRYFTELLPGHLDSHLESTAAVSWAARAAGISSYFRGISSSTFRSCAKFRDIVLEPYVREEDMPLACNNLRKDSITNLTKSTTSINGILLHLENLGHKEAPFVEGLNVELLPFQRQTLQWALERETVPGGLQSLFVAKVPLANQDLYYRPVLESLSEKKPKLVRGGLIADEMGLGKTVRRFFTASKLRFNDLILS